MNDPHYTRYLFTLTLLGGPADGGCITDPDPEPGMMRVVNMYQPGGPQLYGPYIAGEPVLRYSRAITQIEAHEQFGVLKPRQDSDGA